MQRYTVHLVFHIIAAVIGLGCGAAIGWWWFGREPIGLWWAVGALLVGVVLLAAQWSYGSRERPAEAAQEPRSRSADPSARGRGDTRPHLGADLAASRLEDGTDRDAPDSGSTRRF